MAVKNQYRVPAGQWRKWNDAERTLFNGLYNTLLDNMPLFLHPKQEPPEPAHWNTTAWNAAWMAADELRAQRKTETE